MRASPAQGLGFGALQSVALAVAGGADVVDHQRVVAGQGLELVLIGVDEGRHRAEVVHNILDLRAVDQFLALQHAAEQQADDHQHDGDFDQGETQAVFVSRYSPE
jgi:hypothetical protein